jgi:transcriptional regulator with GAF, ATPase, and Fis domain
LILSKGRPLTFDNIVWPDDNEEHGRLIPQKDDFSSLDNAVSKHIQQALEMTKGKIHGSAGAAQLLGINPSTLRHRMRKLRIPHGRQKQRRI